MMTRRHVIWAGAIQVEKSYGERGFDFIDARIDEVIELRDAGGLQLWCKIGEALDQLTTVSHLTH